MSADVRQSVKSELAECFLELDPIKFPKVGNIFLSARHGDGNATKKELFFRDATRPHPINLKRNGRLSYRSITSAKPSETPTALSIEGYVVDGEVPSSLDINDFAWGSLLQGVAEDFQEHATPLRIHGIAQTCIARGYHHTRYPMVPPNAPPGTLVEGECLDCKRRDIVIFRRQKTVVQDRKFNRFPLPRIDEKVLTDEKDIDYSLLVDALCFLGSGSWAKFQSLVGTWGEDTRPGI